MRKSAEDERRSPEIIAAMLALEEATAAKVTALEVREPNRRRTILQTGNLSRANAMMRECAREQMVG